MKVGIVGLPNAGKSTLFNALAQAGAEAAEYPFTTVEPNVAVVPVTDTRLEQLGDLLGIARRIPEHLEVVDIAGLVRGAHKGRGLAIASSATSATSTRSCMSCARSSIRRSRTRTAPWIRSTISPRSRPN